MNRPLVWLGIALALALTVIVVLGRRLEALAIEHQRVRRLAATLHEGGYTAQARLATVAGDSVLVGDPAGASRQVLLVFTTTCPYCKATLPVWRQLADSLRRTDPRIQVFGLSLDPDSVTRPYVEANQLAFPVAMLESPRLRYLFKAGVVPQTVVLEQGGRVRYGTTGALKNPLVLDSVYRAALDSNPTISGRRNDGSR